MIAGRVLRWLGGPPPPAVVAAEEPTDADLETRARRRRDAQNLADQLWRLDRSQYDALGVDGRRKLASHWDFLRWLYQAGALEEPR